MFFYFCNTLHKNYLLKLYCVYFAKKTYASQYARMLVTTLVIFRKSKTPEAPFCCRMLVIYYINAT